MRAATGLEVQREPLLTLCVCLWLSVSSGVNLAVSEGSNIVAFQLDQVVPWGRSLDEYRSMFSLTDEDLAQSILGCADGPASFNSQLTQRRSNVVSCDPIYQFTTDQLRQRIVETADTIIAYAKQNVDEFVWSDLIPNPDALAKRRLATMETFLGDFIAGREDGRYVVAELPSLPFANQEFELCVCSHFLFLYSEQLSEEFHIQAINELARVAFEVRIFPLFELGARRSRHLATVVNDLQAGGLRAQIEEVNYEFQRGANQMLRITRE